MYNAELEVWYLAQNKDLLSTTIKATATPEWTLQMAFSERSNELSPVINLD